MSKKQDVTITDLFSVEIHEGKEYPLNLRFKYSKNSDIDEKAKGPGVYVISYGNKIVYIGQHLAKLKNDNGFVKERCLKHLQTFTSRSHVLKLGKSQAKRGWYEHNAEEGGFYEHINIAGIKDNHFRDGAPLTSKNRIRFSEEQWDDFKATENVENILDGFEIWWFKVGHFKDDEYEHAKGIVKHIETQLICRYLPECNNEFYKKISSYEGLCKEATTDSLTNEINTLIGEISPNENKSVTNDSFVISSRKNF